MEHQSPGLLPAPLPPWVFYLPGCGSRAQGSGCVRATFVSPRWGTHPAPLHGAQHPGYKVLGGTGSSWVWGRPCPHGDRCLRRSGAEKPGWGDTGGNFMGKLRHSGGEKGMERGEGMGGDPVQRVFGVLSLSAPGGPRYPSYRAGERRGASRVPQPCRGAAVHPSPCSLSRRHGLTRAISKMD